MGKAAKQRANAMANKMAYQFKSNKDNTVFLSMIESMEDEKMYRVKKHKRFLFDGLNAPGSFWKSQFLTEK
jgi:hypothetical protein